MKSCVINFYKSNKNYYKEDYESAYICSYFKNVLVFVTLYCILL